MTGQSPIAAPQVMKAKSALFSSALLLLLCFWVLAFGCCLLLSKEVVTALCQVATSHS